jgi:hypothetical protein
MLVGALQRPRYAAGISLAAHDLCTEQRYRLQRLRHHHRYLHGWGVICGELVVPATTLRRPWTVQVCPAYAIGPYADEIEVQTPAAVDVRDYLWRRRTMQRGIRSVWPTSTSGMLSSRDDRSQASRQADKGVVLCRYKCFCRTSPAFACGYIIGAMASGISTSAPGSAQPRVRAVSTALRRCVVPMCAR